MNVLNIFSFIITFLIIMNNEINYKSTPVEGFGSKILAKHGYYNGRGIGRTSKGEIPLYLSAKGREERSGLGSEKSLISNKKSMLKIGDTVKVTLGKHKDVVGNISEIQEEHALLQIPFNTNTLKVRLLSIEPTEPVSSIQNESREIDTSLKWVLPGLIVRIKSKTAYQGKFYNEKGIIEDVYDDLKFSVKIKGEIVEDLREKDIQTIIPPVGESVRIVKGEMKGNLGKLIGRDKKKNLVNVQVFDNILNLKQREVCSHLLE